MNNSALNKFLKVITPFTTDIKHRMRRYSRSMALNMNKIIDPKDSTDIITNVIKIQDRIEQCKSINSREKRHEHHLKSIDTTITNQTDIFSPVYDISYNEN